VVKGIDGQHLFRLSKADLSEVLGVDATAEEENAIWDLISELRTENKQAVAHHWQKAKVNAKTGNIVYNSPAGAHPVNVR
jgi:hypothetical protein